MSSSWFLNYLILHAFAQKPNILFIYVDDVGFNDFGFNGNTETRTPFIDNLVATESLYIERNYVSFLCSPTRAQMLTGRYASHLGLQHDVFQENMPYSLTRQVSLLSNEFQSNGYSTHLIGKYHLGFQSWEYTPTYRGFDTFSGFYNGEETYFSHMAYVKDTDLIYHDLRENEHPDPDVDTYSVYLQRDKFLNLLDDINDSPEEIPFFIYVAFQAAHFPPQAPLEYTSMYCDPFKFTSNHHDHHDHGQNELNDHNQSDTKMDDDALNDENVSSLSSQLLADRLLIRNPLFPRRPLPRHVESNEMNTESSSSSDFSSVPISNSIPSQPIPIRSEPVSSTEGAMYLIGNCTVHHVHMAQMTSLDDAMEIMMNRLKALNLWNNTLIVFSSDNGAAFGYGDNAPLRGGKTTPFEGGIRVPAFVSGGYLSPHRRGKVLHNIPVHVTDWYRTLLSAATLNVSHYRSKSLHSLNGQNGVESVDMRWRYLEDEGVEIDIDGMDLWNVIQYDNFGKDGKDSKEWNGSNQWIDREIVLSLDEVDCRHAACGALLIGYWKLIRGPQVCNGGNCGWNNAFMTNPEHNILGCTINTTTGLEEEEEEKDIYTMNCEEGCLFDLESDPCEMVNVKEENEEIWKMMEDRLVYWQHRSVRPLMGNNVTILESDTVRPTLVCNSTYWCPYQKYSDVQFEEQMKMEYIRLYGSKRNREDNISDTLLFHKSMMELKEYNATIKLMVLSTILAVFYVIYRVLIFKRDGEEGDVFKRIHGETFPLLKSSDCL